MEAAAGADADLGVKRMSKSLRRQLVRNESAAIAPLYAIGIFMLVGIAGVGFDYARMASLDSELQNAADQAALAGATQLDGKAGSRARAIAAVKNFASNYSRLADDGGSPLLTFDAAGTSGFCTDGAISFWKKDTTGSSTGTEPTYIKVDPASATADIDARYVKVCVDTRSTRYVLTPLIDLFRTGNMYAGAMAGLGSSICKQPPIMICHPDPSVPFNADGRKGQGVVATGHSTGSAGSGGAGGTGTTNHWAPGDFGFLQIQDGDAGSRNAKLLMALAYDNPPLDCVNVEDNRVNTGNPQGLYDAINTRFGIYDFPSNGNGNVLAPCKDGKCTAGPNPVMDFVTPGGNGNNACKMHNSQGYHLPDAGSEFAPVAQPTSGPTVNYDDNGVIDRMGLPRDNCHYETYLSATSSQSDGSGGYVAGGCNGSPNGRFGYRTGSANAEWARNEYWNKNHAGVTRPTDATDPSKDWRSMTRYQTYLWELANDSAANSVCGVTGAPQRRVLTVAVVTNCASLTGASQPVVIDQWVDMFLVEPSSDDARRHNRFKDAVYMEIIGKSQIAGNGVFGSQEVRRDVPYLVR